MKDAFRTLAEPASAKLTRQRSRFLAFVEPVADVEAVRTRLLEIRREFRDASHCTSAYRLSSDPAPLEGSDDDGEPAGSAGIPILLQLSGAELENTMAVVVRYFGGVKLGVGGLARAYADATALALGAAHIVDHLVTVRLALRFPLAVNATVLSAIHRYEAKVLEIRYDTEGHATIGLAPSRVAAFRRSVVEGTGARARVEVAS